jgi:hypothetical protein
LLTSGSPGNPQKYFRKLACFSAPENDHPTHHIYPAIHHNFTTKTPRLRTTFLKTTLKNGRKSAVFSPATTPNIFPKS